MRLVRRALPALVVTVVLALSFLAPVPAQQITLSKHCGYGYGYGHGCK